MSISTTLGVNEAGKGHNVLRTVDVGHDGLPVYTIFSERDWARAGTTLATIVRHLDKERGTPTSSIAVLISSGMFKGLKVLPVLVASFYEMLRCFYRGEQESGQQNSLVPLPMFLFDSNVRDETDLTEAKSKWDAWRRDLDGHFSTIQPNPISGVFDKQDVWVKSVEYLTAERLSKDPVGSDRTLRPKSPAYEKVRSILLHILWKCILESFRAITVDGLRRSFRELCDSEYQRAARTVGTPPSSVSVASDLGLEQFERFLGRYRYVTFADLSWIQGCEADVVVACVPANYDTIEPTILWPLLSRSKQLTIAVLLAKNKTEARRHWLGPWHDWGEEMSRHRANTHSKKRSYSI